MREIEGGFHSEDELLAQNVRLMRWICDRDPSQRWTSGFKAM